MLTVISTPLRERDNDWEWAMNRGRIETLESIKVALLGAADYTVDPDNPEQLLSINGTYMEGIRQKDASMRRRGIRWAIAKYRDQSRWNVGGDDLCRIALEVLLGVHTDKDGQILPPFEALMRGIMEDKFDTRSFKRAVLAAYGQEHEAVFDRLWKGDLHGDYEETLGEFVKAI